MMAFGRSPLHRASNLANMQRSGEGTSAMSTTDQILTETAPERSFLGHPSLLGRVAGVEVWERFAFYSLQAILALYLFSTASQGGLGLSTGNAVSIVGAYGGAVYLSSVVGSWISDRILGAERVLLSSCAFVLAGTLALALIPSLTGVGIGLTCVALGSGGLKATASAIVGSLYGNHDARKDAAFGIFFASVSLGSVAGPLVSGVVQSNLGFRYAFGLASIGMALGITVFLTGRRAMPAEARVPADPLPTSQRLRYTVIAACGLAVIGIVLGSGAVNYSNLVNVVIFITIATAISYFTVILRSRRVNEAERKRVVAFAVLFVGSAAYFALSQQVFTTMAIYADTRMNRVVFGLTVPVAWVVALEPIIIVLLTGAFTTMWTRLGSRQPSTPLKFAIGLAFVGGSYLSLLPFSGTTGKEPLAAVLPFAFLAAIGSLLLYPVGLAASAKLAPRSFTVQMMAVFYLSVSLGTALAGRLAGLYSDASAGRYFTICGLAAIGLGILFLLGAPAINRLMGGIR
jgi:POT family proton-dependent oligopeptide transporter